MGDNDILANMEEQFHPSRNSGQSADVLCKACNTSPAMDAGCEECARREGLCLLCFNCEWAYTHTQMAALVDSGDRRMVWDTVSTLGRCDLARIVQRFVDLVAAMDESPSVAAVFRGIAEG